MKLNIKILGCGPSGGVPLIGGDKGQGVWGNCNPDNEKNFRFRSSIYIRSDLVSFLIDAGPDLRSQVLKGNICKVDAILYTHEHADHIMGIDDLRGICRLNRAALPIFGPVETVSYLKSKFDYCFEPLKDPNKIFRPHLEANNVTESFSIKELPVVPFDVNHGSVKTMGYRIGDFAYAPDFKTIPDASLDLLNGVKVCLFDGFQHKEHFTHAHIDYTVGIVNKIGAERGVLTNLGIDLDYDALKSYLPAHIEPAYDGMEIQL